MEERLKEMDCGAKNMQTCNKTDQTSPTNTCPTSHLKYFIKLFQT